MTIIFIISFLEYDLNISNNSSNNQNCANDELYFYKKINHRSDRSPFDDDDAQFIKVNLIQIYNDIKLADNLFSTFRLVLFIVKY